MATVVFPLRLRHLKHEAKIDSVLFKLEEPRTEIQPAQPSKPIEVLQNNKYDHHYRVRISGISESKRYYRYWRKNLEKFPIPYYNILNFQDTKYNNRPPS